MICVRQKGQRMGRCNRYVVLDLEMTGLGAKLNKIIEIGAARIEQGKLLDTYHCLINPKMVLPQRVVELTGITNELLQDGVEEAEGVGGFLEYLKGDILVGHNINIDYSFLKQWCVNEKITFQAKGIDTLKLARGILPADQSKKLESLCTYFDIPREHGHRALDDAIETFYLYEKLADLYEAKGMKIPEPVDLIYHAKRQTKATPKQIERLQGYMKQKGIQMEIPWEILTRSEASRMQDQFYAKYGR